MKIKRNIVLMYAIALLQGMVFYSPIATLYRQAAAFGLCGDIYQRGIWEPGGGQTASGHGPLSFTFYLGCNIMVPETKKLLSIKRGFKSAAMEVEGQRVLPGEGGKL